VLNSIPRPHPVSNLVDIPACVPSVEMVDQPVPFHRPRHRDGSDIQVAHKTLPDVVYAVLEMGPVDGWRVDGRVVVNV
jgi:hypothetical protein